MTRSTAVPVLLALALLTAGCAADDSAGDTATTPTPAASASSAGPVTSPSASASAETRTVDIAVTIKDGKVEPPPRRVKVAAGEQVHLLVTSDVDDEVHVHGYEVEGELEAGRTTTIEFVADQAGVFEVETHESELALLQLEVR